MADRRLAGLPLVLLAAGCIAAPTQLDANLLPALPAAVPDAELLEKLPPLAATFSVVTASAGPIEVAGYA